MDGIPQGLQDSLETDRGSTVWRLPGAKLTTETNRGRVFEQRTEARRRIQGQRQIEQDRQEVAMLRWALGFFIVALIAAVLGFSGIAVAAAGIAKILFYIFLVLFLVSLVSHLLRRT
jgi:uncharacterized membrane protein YtjA (UPF0391 family)